MRLTRLALILHTCLFVALYSLVLASNLLAFFNAYQAQWLLLGTSLTLGVVGFAYWQGGGAWRMSFHNAPDEETPRWLDTSVLIIVASLLFAVFLLRMINYPLSPLGDIIANDLVAYHGVKAYDLVASGSLWVVDIVYGQYPIGYESLLALGVMLGIGVEFAGTVQAFTLVLALLTLFLLLRRYTTLPAWWLLGFLVASFFLPDFYRFILTIGKNDFLLALTVLGALLHAPIGWRDDDRAWHPLGMAMVTMLSLSIKASAVFILVALWCIVLWRWWHAYRQGGIAHARAFLHPFVFVVAILMMFPGGLWVIRNYLMMGAFFSPEISGFFGGSIINNLTNPDLYNSGAQSERFIILMASKITLIVLLLIRPVWRWHALIMAMMLFAFIMAPLGAFHRPERDTLHIEWRYTTHSFLYALILIVSLLAPYFERIIRPYMARPAFQRAVPLVVLLGSLAVTFALNPFRINQHNPGNARTLRDTVVTAPADAPYASIYDYVQTHIRHATIGFSVATPLFLYDAGATNRPYAGIIHPLGLSDAVPPRIPDYLAHDRRWGDDPFRWQPYFTQFEWEHIYSDDTGIIWRRIP